MGDPHFRRQRLSNAGYDYASSFFWAIIIMPPTISHQHIHHNTLCEPSASWRTHILMEYVEYFNSHSYSYHPPPPSKPSVPIPHPSIFPPIPSPPPSLLFYKSYLYLPPFPSPSLTNSPSTSYPSYPISPPPRPQQQQQPHRPPTHPQLHLPFPKIPLRTSQTRNALNIRSQNTSQPRSRT